MAVVASASGTCPACGTCPAYGREVLVAKVLVAKCLASSRVGAKEGSHEGAERRKKRARALAENAGEGWPAVGYVGAARRQPEAPRRRGARPTRGRVRRRGHRRTAREMNLSAIAGVVITSSSGFDYRSIPGIP